MENCTRCARPVAPAHYHQRTRDRRLCYQAHGDWDIWCCGVIDLVVRHRHTVTDAGAQQRHALEHPAPMLTDEEWEEMLDRIE